jgi:hypothetical protein
LFTHSFALGSPENHFTNEVNRAPKIKYDIPVKTNNFQNRGEFLFGFDAAAFKKIIPNTAPVVIIQVKSIPSSPV